MRDVGEEGGVGFLGEGDTLLFWPVIGGKGALGEGDTLLLWPVSGGEVAFGEGADTLLLWPVTPPIRSWVVVLELARAAKRKGLRLMRRVRSGSACPFVPTRNIPAYWCTKGDCRVERQQRVRSWL